MPGYQNAVYLWSHQADPPSAWLAKLLPRPPEQWMLSRLTTRRRPPSAGDAPAFLNRMVSEAAYEAARLLLERLSIVTRCRHEPAGLGSVAWR